MGRFHNALPSPSNSAHVARHGEWRYATRCRKSGRSVVMLSLWLTSVHPEHVYRLPRQAPPDLVAKAPSYRLGEGGFTASFTDSVRVGSQPVLQTRWGWVRSQFYWLGEGGFAASFTDSVRVGSQSVTDSARVGSQPVLQTRWGWIRSQLASGNGGHLVKGRPGAPCRQLSYDKLLIQINLVKRAMVVSPWCFGNKLGLASTWAVGVLSTFRAIC